MNIFVTFFCLILGSELTNGLECYFDTNTTHITELPHVVSCTCESDTQNQFNIHKDILSNFKSEMVSSIKYINVANCQDLVVNLTSYSTQHDNEEISEVMPLITFAFTDINNLQFHLRHAYQMIESISLTNVKNVKTFLSPTSLKEEEELFTLEDIYFYTLIGLASLLVLSWILIFILIVRLLRKGNCCGQKKRKSVSRAQSWRYESNVLVNPTQRQQNQSQAKVEAKAETLQQQRRTESALRQMIPYQLVPQREAVLVKHSYGDNARFSPVQTIGSNKSYTDTSLPYVDDTDDTDDNNHNSNKKNKSDTNSGSYGSRNDANTLPLHR